MEKILSIIIPTYNMERYLEKCLSSLIVGDDLMSRLDIIVVNDGSKDSSLSIATAFAKRYPFSVTVIDKENGNYGSCVNKGLEFAIGKYVKVLDADDTFDTDNLKEYLIFLSSIDVDCVISNVVLNTEDGSIVRTGSYDLPTSGKFTLTELMKYAWTMQMHAVCYRTDIVKSIDYRQTEGISYTDQEWMFLPMSFSKSLSYFPKVIYKYLVGRSGQTVDPKTWDKNLWQEIKGIEVMIQERRDYLNRTPSLGLDYQDARIKARMRTVYMAYFLKFRTYNNNEIMELFDRTVKDYDSNLYDTFNDYHISRIFPFRYIRNWRRNYKPSKFLHGLNRVVYSILCIVKRTPQY